MLGRAALFDSEQSLNINTFNLSIGVRCGSRINIDRLFLNERRIAKAQASRGGSGGGGDMHGFEIFKVPFPGFLRD